MATAAGQGKLDTPEEHKDLVKASQFVEMTPFSRRFLVIYLLTLAVILAVVLVALWSMEFPDARFLQKPPNLSGPAPAAGQPAIVNLDPDQVAAGSAQPMLTVYGYNFSPTGNVLINGVKRHADLDNSNVMHVAMLPADTAQAGSISVTVVQGALSATYKLPVLSSSHVLGAFKIFGIDLVDINEETRLVLLVLFAGALGSYVHAVKSLVDYIGNQTAGQSWFWFYISRPFVGMVLALIFYAVIRGGFLAGTPADAKSVNPFGVVALAGLVGMFSDKATQKLAEVFEVMFRANDTRKDKLTDLEITTAALPPAVAGQDYKATLEAAGGQSGYTWSGTVLPNGLQLHPATGVLDGKVDKDGKYKVKVSVKDRAGAVKEKEYELVVNPAAQATAGAKQ
jgi:hypothetical protein